MKVGVFNIFSYRQGADDPVSYNRRLHEFVQEAKLADELGYDYYWFAEHHFQSEGWEIVPNPLMMMSHVAAITRKIRLGTAVVILPQWHPLRLAEDVAMLDHLSNGRVELGIGRGYNPRELGGFGAPTDEAGNRALTAETLEVMIKAWTERPMSHDGAYYTFPGAGSPEDKLSLMPVSFQQPHVRLWQALYSPESIRSAARQRICAMFNFVSHGLIEQNVTAYREAARAAGWEPGPDDITAGYVTYVCDSRAQAREHMEEYITGFGEFFGGLGFNAVVAEPGEPLVDPAEITWDYLDQRVLACGEPARVTEIISRMMERTGVRHYLLFLLGEDHEHRLRCLERFARDVRPELEATVGV